MRRPFIAGNWKMNGTRASVKTLVSALLPTLEDLKETEVVLLPPFVFLEQVAVLLHKSSIALGAQNVSAETEGPYTGEVSGRMLAEYHCRYVLVGHSERRALYHEDDVIIARKFVEAREAGLVPILCVGETREERDAGQTQDVVIRQIRSILDLEENAEMFNEAIIAYEPVWAIGTGLTATPEEAQEVHSLLRSYIGKHNFDIAQNLSILYGGSMKASNAAQLLAMPDIDGGLVGGASLDAQEFIAICQAADTQSSPAVMSTE